jgi:hypothetical protein
MTQRRKRWENKVGGAHLAAPSAMAFAAFAARTTRGRRCVDSEDVLYALLLPPAPANTSAMQRWMSFEEPNPPARTTYLQDEGTSRRHNAIVRKRGLR